MVRGGATAPAAQSPAHNSAVLSSLELTVDEVGSFVAQLCAETGQKLEQIYTPERSDSIVNDIRESAAKARGVACRR